MVYNLTGIVDNGTTLLGFVQGVNDQLMLGWFGFFMLLGICAVVFMAFISATNDVKKSVSATAFIAFTLTIFLKATDLIGNDLVVYGVLVVTGLAIVTTWKKD